MGLSESDSLACCRSAYRLSRRTARYAWMGPSQAPGTGRPTDTSGAVGARADLDACGRVGEPVAVDVGGAECYSPGSVATRGHRCASAHPLCKAHYGVAGRRGRRHR